MAQAPFFKGDAHGIYLNRNQKFINLILYEAADIVKFLNSPETSFSDARQVLTVQPVMFWVSQRDWLVEIFFLIGTFEWPAKALNKIQLT